MTEVETTRISSKGQVVIPQAVREHTNLREGDTLAVYGEGDTIVMKRVATPTPRELRELLAWGEKFARRRAIRRRDVLRAIREVRAGRR